MATSQNGWPVLLSDSPYLHRWTVPATTGSYQINLRRGSAGFLLCHLGLWFAETIEPVKGPTLDDWGYAYRPIAGQTSGFSNHASASAQDLNALRHGLGEVGTFSRADTALIRERLPLYEGCIRWGGDYSDRKDEMHWEINKPFDVVEQVARGLLESPRGQRLLAANPGQKAVILS